MSKKLSCIFGEVLFDHFPDGNRVLGGAPFNVAWHLQAFGQRPLFLSRVGTDPEGDEIRRAMHAWGMTTDGLQIDPVNPTGRVEVSFSDGEPAYEIVHPSAWDRIEAQATPAECRLLYHGSLGLRDPGAGQALSRLLQGRPETVFVDVNLRPPWWQKDQVLDMLHNADWVKLNADELALLSAGRKDGPATATEFLTEYGLEGLLLTHGAGGAELVTATKQHFQVRPRSGTRVVDTVGAGDGFAAVMILGLLEGWDMPVSLQRAQDFASGIVGNRGATLDNLAFYRRYGDQWNLAG